MEAQSNRLVLAVVNLPPRQIADYVSEVLVLGVPNDGDGIRLRKDLRPRGFRTQLCGGGGCRSGSLLDNAQERTDKPFATRAAIGGRTAQDYDHDRQLSQNRSVLGKWRCDPRGRQRIVPTRRDSGPQVDLPGPPPVGGVAARVRIS